MLLELVGQLVIVRQEQGFKALAGDPVQHIYIINPIFFMAMESQLSPVEVAVLNLLNRFVDGLSNMFFFNDLVVNHVSHPFAKRALLFDQAFLQVLLFLNRKVPIGVRSDSPSG